MYEDRTDAIWLHVGRTIQSQLWINMNQHHIVVSQTVELTTSSKLYSPHIYPFYAINHSQSVNDDVIKWKHFPRYWPFVRGIHRSPVNSTYKGQWYGALMFSLICAWTNRWVKNRDVGDLRRYRAHYDVTVMSKSSNIISRRTIPSPPLSPTFLH